jgi:hypothetical protein
MDHCIFVQLKQMLPERFYRCLDQIEMERESLLDETEEELAWKKLRRSDLLPESSLPQTKLLDRMVESHQVLEKPLGDPQHTCVIDFWHKSNSPFALACTFCHKKGN